MTAAAPLVAALTLALPLPAQPIPTDPRAVAGAYTRTTLALDRAVADWLADGDPSAGAPPRDVTLLALYHQRVVRALGRRPALAERTLGHVPRELVRELEDLLASRRALSRLNAPVSPRLRLRTGAPAPAGRLLDWYREAERRFRVDWEILAAVNLVESAFGRVRSVSSAGAQGPMQFLPGTWLQYGLGGDVHDPRDAILGAANYLRASGAPNHIRRALFAYNRSRLYVEAVMRYASAMTRRPRAFYALYSWQVIIRTTAGDRRLTGPGR